MAPTAPTAPPTTTSTTSVPAHAASFSKYKWVINVSTTILTQSQEDLLAKGPNFAIVPKNPRGNLTLQWWRRDAPDFHQGGRDA